MGSSRLATLAAAGEHGKIGLIGWMDGKLCTRYRRWPLHVLYLYLPNEGRVPTARAHGLLQRLAIMSSRTSGLHAIAVEQDGYARGLPNDHLRMCSEAIEVGIFNAPSSRQSAKMADHTTLLLAVRELRMVYLWFCIWFCKWKEASAGLGEAPSSQHGICKVEGAGLCAQLTTH